MVEKKKILMLCDHPLSTSGVGTQSRWLISGLIDTGKYSFRVFGGAIKHSDYNVVTVNPDFIIKPTDGFGNQALLRHALATEKPDVVLLFNDPRFFIWVWQMEDEIHQVCPIAYNHLWDNPPWPEFNRVLYESTDLINCINYPTYSMLKDNMPEKQRINYVPHAVPQDLFRPVDETTQKQLKKNILGSSKAEHFVALYVSRNARRKMPSDILVSWKMFLDKLETKHGHKNASLLMHTDPLDQEGPNLIHVIKMLGIENNVVFSNDRVGFPDMSNLYNACDVVINRSCFAAGTKVTTSEGYKNIEDIQEGDQVLTHKGRWRSVVQTIVNPPPGKALRVHVAGSDPFIVTHNHKLFAIKRSDLPKNYLINKNLDDFVSRPSKIPVGELNIGDYVSYTLQSSHTWAEKQYDMCEFNHNFNSTNDNNRIFSHSGRFDHGYQVVKLDEDLAYVLGEFVGDGCTNSATVSFNKHDAHLITKYAQKLERSFGIKALISERSNHTVVGAQNGSVIAGFFKKMCGEYSHGKQIPEDIMNAPTSIKQAFLDGYIAADGCHLIDKKKRTSPVWRIRTVSNKLAQQTRELLLSLGIVPRVHHTNNSHGYNENGKIWTIEWNDIVSRGEKFNCSCRTWVHNGVAIARIQKIEEIEFNEPVYNLTVEEDHTYSISVGYNCTNCNEGFGLSVLEAKMCAKPAIAIKTGGLTRQVEDHESGEQFGVALEPEVQCMVGNQMVPYIYEDFVSHKTVSDAFIKMYELSPEERKQLGERCRDHAMKNYDISSLIKSWDDSLSELMSSWSVDNHNRWSVTEL